MTRRNGLPGECFVQLGWKAEAMPLIEPVPLTPPLEMGQVHFIAVGGAGMSPIAALYAELGIPTSGSDQADSETLRRLEKLGVHTSVGHDPLNLGAADTVIVSSAIRADNLELMAARQRGLRVLHRSAGLGALMLGRVGVAIGGTHGKTTTSAMTAVMFAGAGVDPGFVVGSPISGLGRAEHLGGGAPFVIEADESDGSFRQYPAQVVVVTNIEADHLDNWGTPQRYLQGFVEFVTAATVSHVVLNLDDPGCQKLIPKVWEAGKELVTFGVHPDAVVQLSRVSSNSDGVSGWLESGADRGPLRLVVPGRYNLWNAAAAYAAGISLGLSGARLREAASGFTGTHRRFEKVGQVADVRIFDDYAHHPTEVRAALQAARELVGTGRLVACFQPHLFTRTRDFAVEFAAALSLADQIVVLGVYPAREDPIPGVSGRLVADAVTVSAPKTVQYVEVMSDAAPVLARLVQPGDVVLTLGAGDVTRVGPQLLALLTGRSA